MSVSEFPGNHTHGDAYEDAVEQGEDLLDSLNLWMLQSGRPLSQPRVLVVA